MLSHVAETGQPETMPELLHAKIARTEPFIILAEIEIKGQKRPEADRAPCPMCQPNKFLDGRLCYFPALQAAAVIGHCCADKENARLAEAEWKARKRREAEEEMLLERLPLVSAQLKALKRMNAAVQEAERLHHKLRKDSSVAQKQLRLIFQQGGELAVDERLSEELREVGPRGLRGRQGSVDARRIVLGRLVGATMVQGDWEPMRTYREIETILTSHYAGEEEADILLAMDRALTDDHARQQAARGLARAGELFYKLKDQVEDAAKFLDPNNLAALERWGADHRNPQRWTVERLSFGATKSIHIKAPNGTIALSPKPELWQTDVVWPEPASMAA